MQVSTGFKTCESLGGARPVPRPGRVVFVSLVHRDCLMKCNVKVHCRLIPCSGYHSIALFFLQGNALNRAVFAFAEVVISSKPDCLPKTKHWVLSFLLVLCYHALSYRTLTWCLRSCYVSDYAVSPYSLDQELGFERADGDTGGVVHRAESSRENVRAPPKRVEKCVSLQYILVMSSPYNVEVPASKEGASDEA